MIIHAFILQSFLEGGAVLRLKIQREVRLSLYPPGPQRLLVRVISLD